MRPCSALRSVVLVGLVVLAAAGCDTGADVKVAAPTGEVKAVPPPKPEELKGEGKKSVGPGSSSKVGKMGRNPMELAR